ncbi:MAG TPA: hypothetical protein VEO56_15430, partial [Bacteroidota bacterium]|nr:hypothetical protein [Bacteroidota bacterium]
MRAILRCIALFVPVVALVFLWMSPARAQFKINTFDSAVKDSQFVTVFNGTAQQTDPKPYHILTDDATTKEEGAAALRSDWRVHATESWGGMNMLSYTLPTKATNSFFGNKYRAMYGDSTYIDWAGGDHLSLWYNNLVPSNAAGNGVQMRFHIYEAGAGSSYYAGDSTDYEDWYFQSGNVLSDNTPGWHELILPLIDEGHTNSPNASGFSLTDWSGKNKNAVLDWDRIIGYTLEWTSGKLPADTASGVIFYDNLTLGGIGYRPGYAALYRFNNYAVNTADFASGWANDASAINFSEETADTLMGNSVMAWDWSIQVAQSWGGGCNREYDMPASTYFPDLSATHEIQLYAKVVKPVTSTHGTIANKITMRFVLFDYSDGTKEEWYTVAPIRMDSVGVNMGWQMIRMPIDWIQSGAWGDLKVGRFNTPNGTKDGIMAYDKIGGFKIEFSCSADAGEPASDPTLVYSGKVLFSAAVPAGFRQSDHTPPAAVTGVGVIAASKANVITWSDVPNETGATYTAYVSEKPFTSTDDPGVENIPPFGLPVGTQLATHLLRSANTDQQLSLYYGVTATDAAGNTNQPTVVGPFTNTAQGVPTISIVPPAN